MGRLRYGLISTGKLSSQKNVIISETYDRKTGDKLGISVTEQLETVDEQGNKTRAYLKNGLGILTEDGLIELKNAIDEACKKLNLDCSYYSQSMKDSVEPDVYLRDKIK
jgi:hypothetical protein